MGKHELLGREQLHVLSRIFDQPQGWGISIRQGRFLPCISASTRYGLQRMKPVPLRGFDLSEETGSYGMALEQPLLNFHDIYECRGAKRSVPAAEHNFGALRQDLLSDLAGAWLDWHRASDRVGLLCKRAESIRSQQDFAAQLAEENVGNRLDLILIDAERDEALARLETAKGELEAAFNVLSRLAGLESLPPNLPRPRADFSPQAPEALELWIRRALGSNPRLLAEKLQAEEALIIRRAAQAVHLPTVKAGQLVYGKESDTSFIGVQVRIPVFSGGRLSSRSRQALLQHQATLERAAETSGRVLESVRSQHESALPLSRSARTLLTAVSRRRKYLEKITAAGQRGRRASASPSMCWMRRKPFQRRGSAADRLLQLPAG